MRADGGSGFIKARRREIAWGRNDSGRARPRVAPVPTARALQAGPLCRALPAQCASGPARTPEPGTFHHRMTRRARSGLHKWVSRIVRKGEPIDTDQYARADLPVSFPAGGPGPVGLSILFYFRYSARPRTTVRPGQAAWRARRKLRERATKGPEAGACRGSGPRLGRTATCKAGMRSPHQTATAPASRQRSQPNDRNARQARVRSLARSVGSCTAAWVQVSRTSA